MSPRSWTYLAILLALVFHGALMPFTYGQTYDAYIHMFFGNHYLTSWFDPWETRWYTGFTVTAYPPGSHQALGLLMRVIDMRIAFVLMQLIAVCLLIVGVFRFSRLWVNDQAASYAAMLCAFSTSISETLHIFGQLPTVLSIALFLNAIPHISGWIESGKKSDLFYAICLTAATTSVHHVTPLFGTVFFVAPVGIAAWISNLNRRQSSKPTGKMAILRWASPALIRGIAMGLCMLFLIITIVFPYWHWSITDPITQVSIPHGSRENFILKPNLGLMFFVIPWGLLIFFIPYVIKKSLQTSLWPLGLSVLIGLFLGTGGTTPFPRILLGPAFEILTLDRFTFWASILILPFAGLAVQSLWQGDGKVLLHRAFGKFLTRAGLVLMLVSYVSLAIGTALLPTFRPTQPDFIDPTPIVKFMGEDLHSDWRYLTLGFGDQFAYHSALIDAESVDGNYHSARRLPSLMNYSVERLENSKYAGVPGLASLNQFLTNAEKFHLKYVFSNDEFYDPVLHYSGWNPVTRLNNGIRVWEKPDISPLPDVRPRRDLPRYQKLMWGVLPISALTIGMLALLTLALTQKLISSPVRSFSVTDKTNNSFVPAGMLLHATRSIPLIIIFTASYFAQAKISAKLVPVPPETVVERYYQHLDFRETAKAFTLLNPSAELDYGQFLRTQKLTGGLVPSYGKLTSVSSEAVDLLDQNTARVRSNLIYLTSVGTREVKKISAQTESEDSSVSLKQHSGRVGTHRLLPGETSAFRIDFEGYLKIQDQDYNAAYNPEQFSVTELETLPSAIGMSLSTTVCSPLYYKSLRFAEIKIRKGAEGNVLALKVINTGTEIVSTLQLKLSYFDYQENLRWVEPFYLQNNLLPGEERDITILLSEIPERSLIPIDRVTINGKPSSITRSAQALYGVKLPQNSGQIKIDYDAMIYRPLD